MRFRSATADPWHPAAELLWLALWIALLAWGITQAAEVPNHLGHHVIEALVWGCFVLGLPSSTLVTLGILMLGFLTDWLRIAGPTLSTRSAVLLYWLAFLIPAVILRAKRLPLLSRAWQWARGEGSQDL